MASHHRAADRRHSAMMSVSSFTRQSPWIFGDRIAMDGRDNIVADEHGIFRLERA
jgi:hypothetical protein